jgi:hypothetical protein
MASKIHYHGIDKIIAAFKQNDMPYYSVQWKEGKKVLSLSFNNTIDDIDSAAEKLQNYLSSLNTASGDEYYLQLWDEVPEKKERINDGDVTYKFVLRSLPYTPEQYEERSQQFTENRNTRWNELMSRISAIEEKISEPEEEDEEEEEENLSMAGIINQLIQKPEIQTAIMGYIGNLFTKQPIAVAGVPDTELLSLEQSLQILSKHTKDLEGDLKLLADMAEKNPTQFKFLLSMLRK